MIQDVKLGTQYAIRKCAFLLGFCKKSCFFRKSSKIGCEKGCGQTKGVNGVAYDDSYCDNFEGFTRQQFFKKDDNDPHFCKLLPSEAFKICHSS